MFSTGTMLRTLTGTDPTGPRITHYDAHGRIELSGKVLANWVHKATNMLEDTADPGPGDVLALDLPAGHWRALYWALAAWARGAHVMVIEPLTDPGTLDRSGEAPVVVVTDRPSAWDGSPAHVIAVSLMPLARSFSHNLAGGIDEAAELASFPDVADVDHSPEAEDAALSDRAYTLTYGDLVAPYAAIRTLVPMDDEASRMQSLVLVTSVLAAGGSVVVAPEDEDLGRLAEIERASITRL